MWALEIFKRRAASARFLCRIRQLNFPALAQKQWADAWLKQGDKLNCIQAVAGFVKALTCFFNVSRVGRDCGGVKGNGVPFMTSVGSCAEIVLNDVFT